MHALLVDGRVVHHDSERNATLAFSGTEPQMVWLILVVTPVWTGVSRFVVRALDPLSVVSALAVLVFAAMVALGPVARFVPISSPFALAVVSSSSTVPATSVVTSTVVGLLVLVLVIVVAVPAMIVIVGLSLRVENPRGKD